MPPATSPILARVAALATRDQAQYGRVFYALGTSHFFDAKDHDFSSPGLLTLFSERGYAFRLLEDSESKWSALQNSKSLHGC